MSSQAQFEALLKDLKSEDTKTRKRAENQFAKSIRAQRPQILQGSFLSPSSLIFRSLLALLQFGRQHPDVSTRSHAVVLFTNKIRENGKLIFTKLPAQSQALFCKELFQGIEKETESGVLRLFENCLVDVATDFLKSKLPWDDLIPFIMTLMNSSGIHCSWISINPDLFRVSSSCQCFPSSWRARNRPSGCIQPTIIHIDC